MTIADINFRTPAGLGLGEKVGQTAWQVSPPVRAWRESRPGGACKKVGQ